ncbi:E3 ubiquitin-protein ligase RHF1A-like isoform X3 [Ipomoea triloba]|uniref:E3 ubiquitin-protein ligase RHF1A-like isoform X3 n=1 Tax=Ipomoea triloba TaxID=35885 RepID=UPI00125D49E6|nr:E3 ubiquitin-protein ligase RHF1A-like isoform X3 [Ipomoea triloba]
MTNDLILPSECAAPPASFVVAAVSGDDDCSICLEPFSCRDPRTVRSPFLDGSYIPSPNVRMAIICSVYLNGRLHHCKHRSQRSKECPICCRQLVFKDSASQELLAAVEFERNATSRHIVHRIPEVYEANNLVDVGASHIDDSDFQDRILHHPSGSGVTNRACSGNSRRRQISSRVGQASFPVGASSDRHQVTQRPVDEFGNGLPASGISSTSSSGVSSVANVASGAAVYKGGSVGLGYNESFSKNTQRFKWKLQANNNSVKELGREVQREMSVSIAGLAKMAERLDLSSNKGSGVSGPLCYAMGREPQTLGRKENLSKSV